MKNCVRTWRQWNPLSIFLKMQWTPSETRLHLILLGKIDKEEENMVKGCLSCPVVNKGCGACHVFIMTAHKETFLSDSMELIVQRQDKGQHCLERRWESVSTEAVPSWLLSTCSRQVHMKRASLSRPRFSDARTVSPGNPDIQVCTFRGLKKRLGSLNAASSKSHDESSRKKGEGMSSRSLEVRLTRLFCRMKVTRRWPSYLFFLRLCFLSQLLSQLLFCKTVLSKVLKAVLKSDVCLLPFNCSQKLIAFFP